MSLSWANKLAKNALLNAQRKIDSVLDIKEDETAENAGQADMEVDPSIEESTSTIVADEEDEDIAERNSVTPSSSVHDQPMVDVDLAVDGSEGWAVSPMQNHEDVVEAEPNPLRDAHDQPGTSLMYSPSSNSPDEEEHHQSSSSNNDHFDLSMINVEETESISELQSERHAPSERHEDVATVASSDIVVIKRVDDWSVTSGSQRRAGSEVGSSNQARNGDSSDDNASERIATLEAKLRHRDQRIAELSRLSETLKAQNATLTQRNKQISSKLNAEGKLQKQLADKDEELKGLLAEGKKLSSTNSKQSKELKRLREVEKEHEVLTKKFVELSEENNKRAESEAQLEAIVMKLKSRVSEREKELAAVHEKVNEKAEVADDLAMSEQRCQNQKIHIAKLEQRIEDLMVAQREAAGQIAAANAPLLSTIEELESKFKASEAEKYLLQKKNKFADEKAEAATRKSAEELQILRQQLDTLRSSNASANERCKSFQAEIERLKTERSNAQQLTASVESKLLGEMEELKLSLSSKVGVIADLKNLQESEILELKRELSAQSQEALMASVSRAESTPVDDNPHLLEEIHELERENLGIRSKLNELQHAHDTLLELHGETMVRLDEVEQQNAEIKALCKEQTLMIADFEENYTKRISSPQYSASSD